MKRKIVHIDEKKCNGCGLCASACHEGAIEMVNGKARLVSDEYCDGLGDCLPECSAGAIEIIERESLPYDEEKVKDKKEDIGKKHSIPYECPGIASKVIERKPAAVKKSEKEEVSESEVQSELRQWPVQLNLVNPRAPYLKNADLLVAADCTAYAYANFHKDFIKNHITVIGCSKLDDNQYYKEKLTEIIKNNNLKSITVVRMEVPCCGGIVSAVKNAMLNAKVIVPYKEVVIGIDGSIK